VNINIWQWYPASLSDGVEPQMIKCIIHYQFYYELIKLANIVNVKITENIVLTWLSFSVSCHHYKQFIDDDIHCCENKLHKDEEQELLVSSQSIEVKFSPSFLLIKKCEQNRYTFEMSDALLSFSCIGF